MAGLPDGTVTLLFTDIEGSTRLLERVGDRYAGLLLEHRLILRAAFEEHGGREVGTEGDSFFVAFPSARAAAAAALAAQDGLSRHDWTDGERIRVRMGLHTGEPEQHQGTYLGLDVNRAARVMSAAHGGQILVTQRTRDLLDSSTPVQDLGDHRLKDLSEPQRLYQLGDGAFPPLHTLPATNLPTPHGALYGRSAELALLDGALAGDAPVVTLAGPGGIGKTRLAVHAAAESAQRFPDAIVWVALAPLRDPARVLPTVLEALGAETIESFRAKLQGRRVLVLLDNAEHVAAAVAACVIELSAVASIKVLVTSRERLALRGERVIDLAPLDVDAAVELFVARARELDPAFEAPHDALARLAQRLDTLPLALELAAARTRLFTVPQLEQRLGDRLDSLRAGRGVDSRQQTLRATIEWSFDLLDEDERALQQEVSIFAGGFTFDAAEAVAGADPNTLQSLLDKSLVRRLATADAEPRFSMLETIREFAAERRTDTDALRLRHAAWFARLFRQHAPGSEDDYDGWATHLRPERDNVVAALATAAETKDLDALLAFANGARFFPLAVWTPFLPDFERALAADERPVGERLDLTATLAIMRAIVGDLAPAASALRDCLRLAWEQEDTPALVRTAQRLSSVLLELGRLEEADAVLCEVERHLLPSDDPWVTGNIDATRAGVELSSARFENAIAAAHRTIDHAQALRPYDVAYAHLVIGFASAELADAATALRSLREAVTTFGRLEDLLAIAYVIHVAARLLLGRDDESASRALALAEHARAFDGRELQLYEGRFAAETAAQVRHRDGHDLPRDLEGILAATTGLLDRVAERVGSTPEAALLDHVDDDPGR